VSEVEAFQQAKFAPPEAWRQQQDSAALAAATDWGGAYVSEQQGGWASGGGCAGFGWGQALPPAQMMPPQHDGVGYMDMGLSAQAQVFVMPQNQNPATSWDGLYQ